jgi:hypothetical protein
LDLFFYFQTSNSFICVKRVFLLTLSFDLL